MNTTNPIGHTYATPLRMQAILDHLPSMVAWVNQDLEYIYCNDTFAHQLGLSKNEVMGKTVQEVCHISFKVLAPFIKKTLQGKSFKFQKELQIRHKKFFADIHLIPHKNEMGIVDGYYSIINDISGHIEIADELKESKQKFQSIFECSLFGMILMDGQGNILLTNPTLQKLLGYTQEEFTQIDVQKITHPDDYQEHHPLFLQLYEGKIATYTKEKRYFHKNGQIVWTNLTMTVEKDANDHIKYVIGMVEDITEKKKNQQQLKETEEKLALGQTLGKFGTWFYDIKNDNAQWSENTYQLFRLDKSVTLDFAKYLELIHPEDRSRLIDKWQKALQGAPYNIEHRIVSQGITSWLSCNAKIIFDEDGTPSHAIGSIVDITSQKEVKQRLIENKARFESIFTRSPFGIALLDEEGKLFMSNNALQTFLGFTQEELKGIHFSAITHPDDIIIDKNLFNELLQKKIDKYTIEKRYIHKEGHIVWGNLTVTSELDDHANVKFAIGMVEDITEQKKTQALLKESEEKLAIGQAHGKFGSWYYDIKNDDITWSKNTYQLFRLKKEDKLDFGKFLQLIHPEDRPILLDKWQKALQGAPYSIEHRITSQEITTWLHGSAKIFFDEDGTPSYAIGAVIDITERKVAEQKLIDSKRRLSLAQKVAKIGSWYIDPNNNKISWSEETYRIFGVPYHTEIDYNKFLSYIHPDDRKTLDKAWADALNGEPYQVEHRIIVDGKIKWVLETAELTYNEDKTVVSAIGTSQDITEKKLKDKALEESEERYNLAMKGMEAGVWDWNIQTGKCNFSDRWAEIIGYTTDELEPMTVETWITHTHPEDLKIAQQALDDYFTGKSQHYRIEIRMKHKAGHWVWVVARGRVFSWTTDGQPLRMTGTHLDITERKQADIELANYRDNLKELVKEQTLELKAINQDLEAFAYSISHDLRGPLRYIDGFSHLLKRTMTTPSEQQVRYFDNIREGIINMNNMIDALLQFSRLGRKELEKSTIDTNEVVAEAIKGLLPSTNSRNIQWKIGHLPNIEGDYALIKMVFENFISNAIKFTSQEEIAIIEIGVLHQPDKNGKHTIFIKDNGVGFDMAYADKLFGVFQRLHSQEEFEGTGIGLANIKRIINKHNGSIRVEAEENKGACFFITL